jgi:hypothetical protein
LDRLGLVIATQEAETPGAGVGAGRSDSAHAWRFAGVKRGCENAQITGLSVLPNAARCANFRRRHAALGQPLACERISI